VTRRILLTLSCFTALAITTALIVARVTEPRVPGLLVAAAVMATLAGGSGIFGRRSWPLAVFLLPLGVYLLARLQIALPAGTDGLRAQATFYAHALSAGSGAYVHEAFPLHVSSAGVRLLVSLVLYIVIGAAAFLGLSLRRPLAGLVVLLCLAGFGFTTDQSARAPLPAVAFIVLAGGLLALTRPLPREHVRLASAVAGGVTATLAAVLALSVLGATTVEAGRPLQDWRTWQLVDPKAAVLDFDWMQNYPKLLAPTDDAVVMEVRSPVASYWRANVLAEFIGSAWISTSDEVPLDRQARGGSWTYDVTAVHGTQGRTVTERFDVRNTYTDHLFVGGSALQVSTSLPLVLDVSDAGAVAVDPARGPSMRYSVTSFVPDLGPTDLVGRGSYYPEDVTRTYLQLPFPSRADVSGADAERRWSEAVARIPDGTQWSGLLALDERIVGAQSDPYLIALAIQQYLRTRYQYSLHPALGSDSSPYASFLFQTYSGYCQHFAGAMALLLRFNGVPARVAVGFRQGRESRDGVYEVHRTDAHAWVEAYFPGTGWAAFDPTPGRQLPATADATGPAAAGSTSTSGADAGARREVRVSGIGKARVADPGGPGTSSTPTRPGRGRLVWLTAVLALLVAWPAGRALVRRRGLLATSAGDRLRASTGLLYATLRDYGVDPPPSQTLDETARLLHDRFGVDAGDVIDRIQATAFGGRAATEQDVADLRRLRRRLGAALRARSGLRRRLAAAYGLRATAPHLSGTSRAAISHPI
jgi:protein-glutamine gamma-glutamyltransferase